MITTIVAFLSGCVCGLMLTVFSAVYASTRNSKPEKPPEK